jgi:hypothetical protein
MTLKEWNLGRNSAWGVFAALVALSAAWPAQARAGKGIKRYVKIAPIGQYLMKRNAEIALARTAAPPSVSRNAEVLVLGRHGYETAVKGTNGFVCEVERAWTSDFDDPDFENPTAREPVCYNAAAARSILPRVFKLTALALAGLNKTQMFDGIKAAYEKKELPLPPPGAMSYMMSKQLYLGPYYGHGVPHLMFYFPKTPSMTWGGGLPGSPVIVHQDYPEPMTTFVILVSKYSDGSPAPTRGH